MYSLQFIHEALHWAWALYPLPTATKIQQTKVKVRYSHIPSVRGRPRRAQVWQRRAWPAAPAVAEPGPDTASGGAGGRLQHPDGEKQRLGHRGRGFYQRTLAYSICTCGKLHSMKD